MNKPIIFDNAVDRENDKSKVFEYNYLKDLNVINTGNLNVNFIDINSKECEELLTKTSVERERDDEEMSLLELLTKTKQDRESDDDEMVLAELETKTFVDRERDDEDGIDLN